MLGSPKARLESELAASFPAITPSATASDGLPVSQGQIGQNGNKFFTHATWGAYYDAVGATGTPKVGEGYIRDFTVVSEGPQGVIREFTARLDMGNIKGKMYLNEWWASPDESLLEIWYVRFTNDGRAIKRGDANGNKFSNLFVRPDGVIEGKYGHYNRWGGYTWAEIRWTGEQLIFEHFELVGDAKGKFLRRDTYTPAEKGALKRDWDAVKQQIAARKSSGGGGGLGGALLGAVIGGALTGGSAEGIITGARVLGTKDGAQQVYEENLAKGSAAGPDLTPSTPEQWAQRIGSPSSSNLPASGSAAQPNPAPVGSNGAVASSTTTRPGGARVPTARIHRFFLEVVPAVRESDASQPLCLSSIITGPSPQAYLGQFVQRCAAVRGDKRVVSTDTVNWITNEAGEEDLEGAYANRVNDSHVWKVPMSR